jgi:hypothetical protein
MGPSAAIKSRVSQAQVTMRTNAQPSIIDQQGNGGLSSIERRDRQWRFARLGL